MIKLFWKSESGSFVVHVALEQVGADYELIEIDFAAGEHKSHEFLKLNPKGQLPTLILEDGNVMTESVAILLYLDDRFPDAGLLPDKSLPSRAIAYRWLVYMGVNIYTEDLRYYYPERYTVNPQSTDGIRDMAQIQMQESLEILDSVLERQPWLAGDQCSIIDVYLTMMVSWYPDVDQILDSCSNLNRVVRGVYNQSAVDKLWSQYYPDGPTFN